MLEGTLQVEIDGARRTLSEGDRIVVPAGAVHAMWNESPGTTRAAWVTQPALRTEQFFERAWDWRQELWTSALGATLLDDFSDEFRLAPSGAYWSHNCADAARSCTSTIRASTTGRSCATSRISRPRRRGAATSSRRGSRSC